jgi:hypothetical protein
MRKPQEEVNSITYHALLLTHYVFAFDLNRSQTERQQS